MAESAVSAQQDGEGAVLAADRLWKRYENTDVLRDASVRFYGGEVHAIVGENGAGKSTLAKILTGETAPSAGRVVLRGRPVSFHSPADAMAAGIACVYQDLTLLDNLNIGENVLLGIEPTRSVRWLDREAFSTKAGAALSSVGLSEDPGDPISGMQIGRQALVEVAKWRPRAGTVLILDEPTSALGPEETDLLFSAISELREQGVAIIYISHRLWEIERLADVATVLRDGEIVGTLTGGEITSRGLIELMVGQRYETVAMAASAGCLDDLPPTLEVRSLRGLRFRGISFSVRAGEIVGIAGQVGSGAESLAETLAGWREPLSGQVFCGGARVAAGKPRSARRAGLVFLPADRKVDGLAQTRPAWENIAAGAGRRAVTFGLVRRGREALSVEHAAAMARLDRRFLGRETSRLSGGQQQKVLLAQCLAAQPRVLVVIEPTRGVDVKAREEIHAALRDSCERDEMAILVTSSDSEELARICSRVLILRSGEIVEEISGSRLSRSSILEAMTSIRITGTETDDADASSGGMPDKRTLVGEKVSGRRRAGAAGPVPAAELVASTGNASRVRSRPQESPRRARWRSRVSRTSMMPVPAIAGVLLIGVVIAIGSPYFLTGSNLGDVGRQVVILALASLGEMLVILQAGIDLSVGAVITLTNLVSTFLLLHSTVAVAIVVSLAIGLLSGAICGVLVVLGLPAFLVTYAVGLVEGGLSLLWFPQSIGPTSPSFWRVASAQIGGVPISTLALLAVVGLTFAFLSRTATGRHLFATGRDLASARRSGLAVRLHVFSAYCASGLLCAAAGIYLTARVGGGLPNSGTDVTLDAIAAVMVGGASFFGGRVSVVGTAAGALLLTLIGNGIDLLHVNGFLNDDVLGVIVLVVVGSWSLARRPRRGQRVVS